MLKRGFRAVQTPETSEIARTNEGRERTAARRDVGPIVGLAGHHRQAGGREFDLDLVALVVAIGDQQQDQILQPGIVSRQQQAVRHHRRLVDQFEQGRGRGQIGAAVGRGGVLLQLGAALLERPEQSVLAHLRASRTRVRLPPGVDVGGVERIDPADLESGCHAPSLRGRRVPDITMGG